MAYIKFTSLIADTEIHFDPTYFPSTADSPIYPVADRGEGALLTLPSQSICSYSYSFGKKTNNRLAPPLGLTVPLGNPGSAIAVPLVASVE